MIEKWEYKWRTDIDPSIKNFGGRTPLDEMGNEGWEAVNVTMVKDRYVILFKRKIVQ
jgi:hypothetical protein